MALAPPTYKNKIDYLFGRSNYCKQSINTYRVDMKYAFSNGLRLEATPSAKGTCQCCGAEMVAKCGTMKVWHWSHKGRRLCDHWWEPETEWHREWKDLFPEEWQEVVGLDSNGEKHIADLKTPEGFVVEFQHSSIKQEEKLAREKFYKNMVWVVDGRRTKNDYPRFQDSVWGWRNWPINNTMRVHDPEYSLPKMWLNRTVPVIFDWGLDYDGGDELQPLDLVCLLPQEPNYSSWSQLDYATTAECFRLTRKSFLNMMTGDQLLKIPKRSN